MGFVAPAMAEPTNTGTFPSDGYMQEDYTYTNAATAENMDTVYEGTVNANAEYTDILYDIVAGNYLAAGSEDENGTQCTAGNFCPGLTNAYYNENADQGINSCSTATNGIYALSAAGSDSQNDCYRTCTTADVAHSASVTGGYYYGNNNQCEPTACVNGWHLKQGLNLTTAIGTGAGENSAYVNERGQFTEKSFDGAYDKGQSYYGISDNYTWAVDYGTNGMLIGQARCSTVEGVFSFNWSTNQLNQPITTHTTSELGSEGGKNCYCNVTGYKGTDGTMQAVSSSWVFITKYGLANYCAQCPLECAARMRSSDPDRLAFRAALLGSVQPGLAMCEANVININWNDVDPEYAGQNNEGTATYGSDVRTPVKAQTIKGKTFKGWRFSKPEQTNLP